MRGCHRFTDKQTCSVFGKVRGSNNYPNTNEFQILEQRVAGQGHDRSELVAHGSACWRFEHFEVSAKAIEWSWGALGRWGISSEIDTIREEQIAGETKERGKSGQAETLRFSGTCWTDFLSSETSSRRMERLLRTFLLLMEVSIKTAMRGKVDIGFRHAGSGNASWGTTEIHFEQCNDS